MNRSAGTLYVKAKYSSSAYKNGSFYPNLVEYA